MKFPIHLRCADRDSRWPFRSLSTILHTKPKAGLSEPPEHNLIHGQRVLPEEDWLTISYRDERPSDYNLALSHSLRSTPRTLPLHRGRPSSTQERYSTPTARNDTRRYAVYLPDYDFSTLLANRPIKIDPTMLTPTTAPCPPPARDRQVRSRRPRQVTYRPENVHDPDPPPQYSATDPHPLRRSRRVRMNIVQGMQDVGRIAKDLPTSVKGAQKRVNEKRARGKMQWLERHNFLSAQDRLLREELRH